MTIDVKSKFKLGRNLNFIDDIEKIRSLKGEQRSNEISKGNWKEIRLCRNLYDPKYKWRKLKINFDSYANKEWICFK